LAAGPEIDIGWHGCVGNDQIDAVHRQFGDYPIEFHAGRDHFIRVLEGELDCLAGADDASLPGDLPEALKSLRFPKLCFSRKQ
jgi:hypothetical protein